MYINIMKQNLETISYQNIYDKIIKTFPIYYKIFEKYYLEGKDVSYELNRLYKPIFVGLIEHYDKLMTEGISNIIYDIKIKYNPDKPYAIIDYIEYIYGNILYETFLFEIKKIDIDTIRYEHLCIFEYIITVELIKYKLYLETINKIESGSKLILAMKYRLTNCEKKIFFSLGWLEKYCSKYVDVINICKNIILESNLNLEIKINIVDNCDSFMKLNKI